MRRKIYRIWQEFSRQMNEHHISAYASSAAFFTFLSLIPMLLLLISAIPYTPITKATLMMFVTKILPQNMEPLSVSIIDEVYEKTGTALSLSILATIWSAAKGMLALIRGLNTINGVTERRNYIFLRLRACVYTVIMMIMILILLILVVFGERIVDLLTASFPNITYMFRLLVGWRWIVVVASMALLICAIYTFLPNEKNRFLREVPGAVMVSICWYISSWVFSVYVNRFSGFSTYGSLTTVIIIMLWLYMCFYIMLLGAFINRFLQPAFSFLYGAFKSKHQKHRKKKKSC